MENFLKMVEEDEALDCFVESRFGFLFLRRKRSRVLYVDHIEGRLFFEKVCELDLEGIVAKRKHSQYRATERPLRHWVKIKNPKYSQAEGRDELFNPKPEGIEGLNVPK